MPPTKRKPTARVIPLKSARASSAPVFGPPKRGRPPKGTPSVASTLKAVMGRRKMTAAEAAEALVKAGVRFKSTNVPALMTSVLSQTTMRLKGPNGKPLRDKHGDLIKVHMFTAVKRGVYRVSTPDDLQKEALEILDGSDSNGAAAGAAARAEVVVATDDDYVAPNGTRTLVREMFRETIRGELRSILQGDPQELKVLVQSEFRSLLQEMLSGSKS